MKRWGLVAVFAILTVLSVARSEPAVDQTVLNRRFTKYEIHQIDPARATERLSLEFGGRRYELRLEVNNLRSPAVKWKLGDREEAPPIVSTYAGIVEGEEGSDVRLLINERLVCGYVRTAHEWLFIEPLSFHVPGQSPEQVVVYRDTDVRPENLRSCAGAVHAAVKAPRAALAALPASRVRRVQIATDADAELFAAFQTNSNLFVEGLVNQVDGIYRRELGLTLEITFQNVFIDLATQPYTSAISDTLLEQFRDEWNANRTNVTRDVAHLFTGKDLDGLVAGIAFFAVVCDQPDDAYSLTTVDALAAKVLAHELGHNLGADHDDQVVPPAATCTGTGPIMCSSVQRSGPNAFSQRSKDDIADHLANSPACLDELPTADLSVSITDSPEPGAVGFPIAYSVTISNAGPDDATGVVLTMRSPFQTITVSSDSTLGTCLVNGRIFTCGPGSIPAGSTASASLVVQPLTNGEICVTAKAVADQADFDPSSVTTQCTTVLVHDLAVIKMKAPKKISFSATVTNVVGRFAVSIQNNGDHTEVIPDLAALANLVTLTAHSLGGCPDITGGLVTPKFTFPLSLAPKKKLNLAYTAVFSCANDPLATDKTTPHNDYRIVATVNHTVLDGPDSQPANNACPHNPFGSDKGCGGKTPTGTLGGDLFTDVIVK